MVRELGDFNIGNWSLTMDLLGTASKMGEADWLTQLNEFLNAISLSVKEALASSIAGFNLVQYGDSVTFSHNDADALVFLGISLQVKLFAEDILAQLALSCGGVYYLDDTTIHQVVDGMPNFKLHCLVGRGVARSHLALRRVRGPRFLIDEEIGDVQAIGSGWSRVLIGAETGGDLRCSEVRWWENVPDIANVTEDRIHDLQAEIKYEQDSLVEFEHLRFDIERKVSSLQKRLDHYKCFGEVLKKDPGN